MLTNSRIFLFLYLKTALHIVFCAKSWSGSRVLACGHSDVHVCWTVFSAKASQVKRGIDNLQIRI